MKQLILLIPILLSASLSFASEQGEWKQVGNSDALREVIALGLSKESSHEEIEEDLNELIPLSLDAISSLPSPRVKFEKEWIVVNYSVTTEFSMTSESFAIRANFEKKEYEVIDLPEDGYDLGIRSNQHDLGLFDNESLFASMKHVLNDGKPSIEVVNLWK